MKTLVSQRNRFEPSSERGNFLNLAKYGDIPSSHGDIPVVFCPIYVIELKSKLNWVLLKFLPTLGALFWLLQVSRMQVFMTCTFFKYGFSLDAKPYPILGSYEVHPRSYYLPFPVYSVPPTFQQNFKPISFKKREHWILQLTLENVSRRRTFFQQQPHTIISNLNRSLAGRRRLTAWLRVSPYHRVRSLSTILYVV